MEIELKYNLKKNTSLIDLIEALESISGVQCDNQGQQVMVAYYYDTDTFDLLREGYAVRIRKELNQWIATVKTSGKAENGLHKREEYNCIAKNIIDFKTINIDVFEPLKIYKDMKKISSNQLLKQLFKSEIKRDQLIINYKDATIEVVYDKGEVIAGEKISLVKEIELELLTGKEETLLEIGNILTSIVDLEASDISKFGRGLELVGYHK